MLLELNDGMQLNPIAIFGGPRLVDGVLRDTLRIEFEQTGLNTTVLRSIFTDSNKTMHLYTYNDDIDEDGNVVEVKTEVGEGYCIFVSVSDETRKIMHPPGKILPDVYEDIFVVNIAQMTYDEYTALNNSSI
jgi:hypothetical protein